MNHEHIKGEISYYTIWFQVLMAVTLGLAICLVENSRAQIIVIKDEMREIPANFGTTELIIFVFMILSFGLSIFCSIEMQKRNDLLA
jgi:hypothetical protein